MNLGLFEKKSNGIPRPDWISFLILHEVERWMDELYFWVREMAESMILF